METITLSDEQVTEHLQAIIEEFGEDHVYTRPPNMPEGSNACFYATYENGMDAAIHAYPTGPGCIIGHLLFRAGASLEDLSVCDNEGTVGTLVDNGWLQVSHRCRQALAAAQERQDSGHPWGQ